MSTVTVAVCPECDNPIKLRSTLMPGQLVKCGQCGEILSLLTLTPPTFTWASEEFDLVQKQKRDLS